MSQEIGKMAAESNAETGSIGEGEWNYLRAHLDQPRFPALPLAGHFPPQSLSGLGVRLTAWLAQRWRHAGAPPARLVALARLPLGPRQAVTMVDADGIRILVGTSADGAPTFWPLPNTANANWQEQTETPSFKGDSAGGSAPTGSPNLRSRSSTHPLVQNWDGSLLQTSPHQPFPCQASPPRDSSIPGMPFVPAARGDFSRKITGTLRHKSLDARRSALPSRISW